jgi:hypothetical protein
MDENMSQAITMFGTALLFVIALSCAVIAYDGLTTRTEQFMELDTISGKMEDATTVVTNPSDIERKATFAEVYMAILNLPKYISVDGNSGVSEILVGTNTYSATVDVDTGVRKIILDGSINAEYTYGLPEDMDDLLKDFCSITLGGSIGTGNSNEVLKTRKTDIEAITFSLQYDTNSIIYTKN